MHELTHEELSRLHPRTNVAVLRRLVAMITDDAEPSIRATLLSIAERGPQPEPPAEAVTQAATRPSGSPRRLAFLPGDYQDVVSLTVFDEEAGRLLRQLFSADPPRS